MSGYASGLNFVLGVYVAGIFCSGIVTGIIGYMGYEKMTQNTTISVDKSDKIEGSETLK